MIAQSSELIPNSQFPIPNYNFMNTPAVSFPVKVVLVSLVVSNTVLCVKQAQRPVCESSQAENTVKSGF
ncbi:hypothetical protein [Microcoleus sp. bin38.metabat.b11b12b14.051]|uniref:hypothetical protein n=1 Tax=Microcoleus sp. bin38.metabat.b11b12b14.051 TaxID=2742709 RepID=UPI0025F1EABF|nr:hypothetical protein [Microcoleus sp. bin38.metabat.b11b12b14.051]